jgi:hypothetical protein
VAIRILGRAVSEAEDAMDGNYVDFGRASACLPLLAGRGAAATNVMIHGTDWKQLKEPGKRLYFKRAGRNVTQVEVTGAGETLPPAVKASLESMKVP